MTGGKRAQDPAKPGAGEQAADDRGGAVGPLAPVMAAHAATVSSAKWLLGAAASIATVLLAGFSLTQLNEAPSLVWTLAAAGAVLLTVGMVTMIVKRAAHLMRVPFATLGDLNRQRLAALDVTGAPPPVSAGEGVAALEAAAFTIAQASGGGIRELPGLTKALQDARNAAVKDEVERLEQLAALAVAQANRTIVEGRFVGLRRWFAAALVVGTVAALLFVVATRPPTAIAVEEVTLAATTDARCGYVWAVGGSWPRPERVVIAGDAPARCEDDDGMAVPAEGPAVGAAAPVTVWLGEGVGAAVLGCEIDEVDAWAVGGRWPVPVVAVPADAEEGCQAAVLQSDARTVIAVPRAPDQPGTAGGEDSSTPAD